MPFSSIRIEFPSGKPACPARSVSSERVPVEIVRRPSSDDGRVPGIDCFAWICCEDVDEPEFETTTFLLRNDMFL